MGKFAIVATIKIVRGEREEYLKHLKAHAQRCLATEPGTLNSRYLCHRKKPTRSCCTRSMQARRPSKRIGMDHPSSKPTGTLKA
jgi:hypothetical protein